MSISPKDSFILSDGSVNLTPNDDVLKDKTWNYLFKEIKRAIRHFNLLKYLVDLDEDKYSELRWIAYAIVERIKGRVVFLTPDGRVVIDTSKGQDGNTYQNYLDDIISENHNNRVSVFQAQCDRRGIGYEKKFSNTIRRNEIYLAVRLGPFRNTVGTLRFSVVEEI